VSLDDCFCVCSTMARIDPPHLLWALESLADGRLVNQVLVPERTAHDARIALDRMLAIR
jgi:quinolinate synthase